MTSVESTAALIEQILRDQDLEFERVTPDSFAVALPGEKRLKTACWLNVGAHAVQIEAFVMRKPDENHQQVYRLLLQQNARMYAVSWAIDDVGDVYLAGKLPLSAVNAEEIDRVLGSVLEYADSTFNQLLELGFGASIKREWAWRVKRGESLANLAAFAGFAQRSEGNDAPSAERPAD